MTFPYEPAHRPMRPAGRCQPGAVALRDTIRYLTPGLIDSGCYNPRKIAGSDAVSTHAEGRAIDLRPANYAYTAGPWLDRSPASDLTTWVAALVDHHATLGVQAVLWAGKSWRVGRGWRAIPRGSNQHYDHAHIELTRHAAATLTPAAIVAATLPPEDDDMFTDDDRRMLAEVNAALVENRRRAHSDRRSHDLATPILETRHAIGQRPSTKQIAAAVLAGLDDLAGDNPTDLDAAEVIAARVVDLLDGATLTLDTKEG